MIIAVSGSVGSGKTTISKVLSEKIGFDCVHLNEKAEEFKLNDVKELQTFDFDLDKLLNFIENDIKKWRNDKKNVILESHFAHFINPELVDVLFVISRDLKKLKQEYIKRGYNDKKQEDNLEVESFNLCFYEAIENGFGEEIESGTENEITPVFLIENDDEIEEIVDRIKRKIKKISGDLK